VNKTNKQKVAYIPSTSQYLGYIFFVVGGKNITSITNNGENGVNSPLMANASFD